MTFTTTDTARKAELYQDALNIHGDTMSDDERERLETFIEKANATEPQNQSELLLLMKAGNLIAAVASGREHQGACRARADAIAGTHSEKKREEKARWKERAEAHRAAANTAEEELQNFILELYRKAKESETAA